MKQKCVNLKVEKHKQVGSIRQNDKLEQWVMQRAVKDEVLGSILGSNKHKVFFDLQLYLLYRKSIPIFFNINQFKIKRVNPFNKKKTDKKVTNSNLM